MESVTTGNLGLVAVGADWEQGTAAAWTSADGFTWVRVQRDETIFDRDTEMSSVTSGGPGLVAVGAASADGDSAAAVWTSEDGTSWSRVPHDESIFGGPGLVAVGESHAIRRVTAPVWLASLR